MRYLTLLAIGWFGLSGCVREDAPTGSPTTGTTTQNTAPSIPAHDTDPPEHRPQPEPESQPAPTGAPLDKVLDGRFGDWDEGELGEADGRWVWLRFAPTTRPLQAIQAAPYSTRVRIDADRDASTGRRMDMPRAGDEAILEQPQGVDLLIAFSPPDEQGALGGGTGVTRYDARGEPTAIGHAALGVSCLPTYASTQYELRLDRLSDAGLALPESGKITLIIDQVEPDATPLWSQRVTIDLPPRDPRPGSANALIPTRPEHAVRVMSTNVLYSAPLEHPAPFARVLDAAAPDVVLYQEWFRAPRPEVEAWVGTHAGEDWTLHFPDEGAGVAIATRLPVIETFDDELRTDDGRSTRLCAAVLDTHQGRLIAVSVHLKCCGSADSDEDRRRVAQAGAINAFVRTLLERHPDAMVVIGGDYNLVGTRAPLDTMAHALSADGSDLTPAPSPVLGEHTGVTWVNERSSFAPGRLDWILYDDATAALANALTLDTRVLTEAALLTMGLQRDDSDASDHLPLIVDLVPR